MRAELKAGNPVYDSMTDLFKFHQNYGIPENDDRYWIELVEKVNELVGKYKGTEVEGIVCRHLVEAMEMLNKKAREGHAV